jgi:hypothetical protein
MGAGPTHLIARGLLERLRDTGRGVELRELAPSADAWIAEIVVGARDLDRAERELLDASAIVHLRSAQVPDRLEAELDALARRIDQLYVHVDLDVLDGGEGMVNAYSGGPGSPEASCSPRSSRPGAGARSPPDRSPLTIRGTTRMAESAARRSTSRSRWSTPRAPSSPRNGGTGGGVRFRGDSTTGRVPRARRYSGSRQRQGTMIRRLGIALILSLALLAPACKGTENVVGTPIGGQEGRTLASMLPHITKSLTAPHAELTFGPPDAGSGGSQVLFIYNVENGRKVNLSFPNPTDPIALAWIQEKNGGTTPITIKD